MQGEHLSQDRTYKATANGHEDLSIQLIHENIIQSKMKRYHTRINRNILLSEDHEPTPLKMKRINQASDYLQELLQHENAGVVTHEIFYAVNDKVRVTSNHSYSTHKRCCEWNGILQEFEDPCTIEQCMQNLIDQFNSIVWNHKQQNNRSTPDIARLLSRFTIDFLHIHPLGNGNGRTIKCIVN